MAPQDLLVNGAYAALDRAAALQLEQLRHDRGITDSCRRGCCHCCRFHIVVSVAEGHTLAQYIKREFANSQIDELHVRMQQWHQWDNSRPGRGLPAGTVMRPDLVNYEQRCPLLVDDECSAYPARPIACRAHYVRSEPQACLAAIDPASTAPAPVTLTSVLAATSPFAQAIRERVEAAGLDFSRSRMLLPHCLAIEMGWEFTASR